MKNLLPAVTLSLSVTAALSFTSCGDDPSFSHDTAVQPGGSQSGGGSGVRPLGLVGVTHSGGQALPHRALDPSGSGAALDLRSLSDFRSLVNASNPVLPTPSLPVAAVLPSGKAGSHFVALRFTGEVDPASIFALPASAALGRAISLTTLDPVTGVERIVPVRALVGGVTAVTGPQGPVLERWLTVDPSSGQVLSLTPEAVGFLDVSARRERELVGADSVVLIADSDDDLSTIETFPAGGTLQLRITADVLGAGGQELTDTAFVSMGVGPDSVPPAVARDAQGALEITPVDGAVNVDPSTELTVRYTESVQPHLVGEFIGAGPSLPSAAVSIAFGPPTQRSEMAITVEPVSPFDLSTYRIVPVIAFPGAGPGGASTGFNAVDLAFHLSEVQDLSGVAGAGSATTSFTVGEGPGIVNAPVLPDAVLAIRSGPSGDGLSVIDLNGFGASTGNPVSSPTFPLKGESRYPFNPNVRFQPGVLPPPGTTTVDGGSAGAFTLTLDSALRDLLTTTPALSSIGDVQIGHALDTSFRNAPPPFGCQAGGGNVCTLDGLKVLAYSIEPGLTVEPRTPTAFGGQLNPGYENLVSWAPQPNPPPISYPPVCLSPYLNGAEPATYLPTGMVNLLVPGDPLGELASMTPPSGLASLVQNSYFVGPSFGQTSILHCDFYMVRQQVGHFVYAVDRQANEIVVLNSNRMFVVERIAVTDPYGLAMSSNLELLAVTSPTTDTVTFIDIAPTSGTFHQVIATPTVGNRPSGIAWSPENEDVLVCNEGDGTVTVISAATLVPRKTVSVPGGQPFDVVVTERESGFGLNRQVYYGYILTRGGELAVFESGPNGANGWGYDDVIGTLPFQFQAPKTLQLNLTEAITAVAVVHEGPYDLVTGQPGALGDGAISTVAITSGLQGTIPLQAGTMPQFRSIVFDVVESLGASTGHLSGIPSDVAFDEMWNLGALPGTPTAFSAGSPLPANAKGSSRETAPVNPGTPAVVSNFLLAAVPAEGVVDVVRINAAGTPRVDVDIYTPGLQSIEAAGVKSLGTYWKQ